MNTGIYQIEKRMIEAMAIVPLIKEASINAISGTIWNAGDECRNITSNSRP